MSGKKRLSDAHILNPDRPLAFFKLDDPAGKVFNVYETPEFKDLVYYYKDLADHNAWSKSALNSKLDHQQEFRAGKTASITHNLGTLGALMTDMREKKTTYELALADINPDKKKSVAVSTQNGISIHATSKNPERALMVVDLLQNDKELHDLIMYGISGVHYNPVGEDKYTNAAQNANFTGFSNWGFNSPLNRDNASFPEEGNALTDKWEGEVYHYPLETFVFDNSNVKTEVANVGNVMLQYGIPLEYGTVKDVDAGLAKLQAQVKAAGIDKIIAEVQRQIDEFLANSAQ
ncbi:hypothetical protein KC345_g11540 [Hortaea werneckii]|nr:hypothetical protein KC345_g11540 [Hortaea werneckii]